MARTVSARSPEAIKAKIREYLDFTLPECFIPELGEEKTGKVRSIYFKGENVLMVTNDRVSAFDFVLPNLIPFKGQVLNMISEWAFKATKDIIPNALVETVDENVVIQKRMKNLNVELIVRGYLWGSMAASYEKGERQFCGVPLAEGLIRFQRIHPIFTPTTKAEVGHDENITMEEVEKMVGKELAEKAKEAALKLFARGQALMRAQGLILIDTKYEFGTDEKGVLHVIDEVNTPDSSRLISIEEYENKYPKIKEAMNSGKYESVTELLKAQPELKMTEFSKQYVRDALLDMGFDPAEATRAPKLSEEQVVECSYRYIKIYEQITGNQFQFPRVKIPPGQRIVLNLQQAGLIKGAYVVVAAGSDSDLPHLQSIQKELTKLKIPSIIRICSAHKQPARLQSVIELYNKSVEPVLFIGCAGGTDALSGTASYLSVHPVISCPPDGMNPSCLTNPPGSSNSFIKSPANAAKFAAQYFATSCEEIREALQASIAEKIVKLEQADGKKWAEGPIIQELPGPLEEPMPEPAPAPAPAPVPAPRPLQNPSFLRAAVDCCISG